MSTEFAGVIREHGPALQAYVTRLTGGDWHLAEDVVQETWLRAWKNTDRLNDLGSVRGWLRRVAHNVAIDQHRRRRARPDELPLPDVTVLSAAMLADPAEETSTRVDLGYALDTLTPAQRGAVVEVYFADRTAATAAAKLGVPAGTVKSRVRNALTNLRETLDAPRTESSALTRTSTPTVSLARQSTAA